MMLVGLKNSKGAIYASSLAKQIDCTYSHVVKILQEMEKAGLINFEKHDPINFDNHCIDNIYGCCCCCY